MTKSNDPPAEDIMVVATFELEPALKQRLEEAASVSERSLSGLLRFIAKQYLDQTHQQGNA